MNRKERIHDHLKAMASELIEFIVESESSFPDRWVPATHIKDSLQLSLVAYPKSGTQRGEKGWLFQILARMLEDEGRVEYMKHGNRAFYRSNMKPDV